MIAFGFARLRRALAVALMCSTLSLPAIATQDFVEPAIAGAGTEGDDAESAAALGEDGAPESETVAATIASPDLATQSWIPTAPGTRSTYVYVQERSRALEGQEAEVEKIRGTRIDEVAARDPNVGEDVIRVDSKLHAKNPGAASETIESHSSYYRVNGSRVELVAERSADPTSAMDLVTNYEVPLSILEVGGEPGQRWEVGVQSQRDLHTRLEGEIVGVQAVDTPAGHFERSLVIRLTGEISGVVEAYGTRMEVPSGEVTLTRWYVPGHGLVLAKEERSQTLVLEDGRQMDYSERTQYALRSAEMPRPARETVAPAAPANTPPEVAP